MSQLRLPYKICGAVCFLAIVASAVLALLLIWTDLDRDLILRLLMTSGVVFLAPSLTIGTIQAMRRRDAPTKG